MSKKNSAKPSFYCTLQGAKLHFPFRKIVTGVGWGKNFDIVTLGEDIVSALSEIGMF